MFLIFYGYTINTRNVSVSISILNNLVKLLKELFNDPWGFSWGSCQGFGTNVFKALQNLVEFCSIPNTDTLDQIQIDSVSVKSWLIFVHMPQWALIDTRVRCWSSVNQDADWVLTKYCLRCPLSIKQDVDRVLIKGINRHSTTCAFKNTWSKDLTQDPQNTCSRI